MTSLPPDRLVPCLRCTIGNDSSETSTRRSFGSRNQEARLSPRSPRLSLERRARRELRVKERRRIVKVKKTRKRKKKKRRRKKKKNLKKDLILQRGSLLPR